MLFNTVTVLGLAATAIAAPTLEKKEAITIPRRGVNWTPARSVAPRSGDFGNGWSNFGNNFDVNTIIQETQISVLQVDAHPLLKAQIQEETLFAQTLTNALTGAQLQFIQAVDNIRINTLNQLNSNVNIVAVVVTEIIDNRNSNNRNTRYLARQIQSNPSISKQVFVVIQEQSTLTVVNNIPTSVLNATQASGTGIATPTFGSYTPGGNVSALGAANNFQLFPSGAALPSFANARNLLDPATITLSNQQLFVQSTQDSESFTSIIEAELGQSIG